MTQENILSYNSSIQKLKDIFTSYVGLKSELKNLHKEDD